MHHALFRPFLAGTDNTIIPYYSHKNSYFAKTFLKKWSDKWQGILNGRYHWKLHDRVFDQSTNLFWINMRKKSARWMDKFTKKILMECSVSTQKQPLSKVSACCRCSLPSWLLVGMGLLAWCNCNSHYYSSGLLQVQQTALMIGYCYNKYECWSGACVSDMRACMHRFTDMTVG